MVLKIMGGKWMEVKVKVEGRQMAARMVAILILFPLYVSMLNVRISLFGDKIQISYFIQFDLSREV